MIINISMLMRSLFCEGLLCMKIEVGGGLKD
jgi:hypothetical protein